MFKFSKITLFLWIITLLCITFAKNQDIPIKNYEEILKNIVYKINLMETTWEASVDSIPKDLHTNNIKYLTGALISTERKQASHYVVQEHVVNKKKKLPKTFDAREHWKFCPNIGHVYDQGMCGSCWAVSTTTAYADRLCIATKGKLKLKRSAHQALTCCNKCKPNKNDDGCDGGYEDEAWSYTVKHGLVTGGDYNSSEGCQPYQFQGCDHTGAGSSSLKSCSSLPAEKAGKCEHKCSNKEYKVKFRRDKVKGKSSFHINNTQDAMTEIHRNGPITAIFRVYDDFFTYKRGVYQHMEGDFDGYHAVRVIGWGEDDDVLYWLVANSWNESWGEKGFFKIIRGKNHLLFEQFFHAGLVK